MTLTIQIETYKDCINDMEYVLSKLYKEVDIYPEEPTPNINHDEFIRIDESGSLVFVTCRDGDKLVGFHCSIVMKDLYYKHLTTAFVTHYMLLEEYRGNGNGTKLFKFAENEFRNRNTDRVFQSRKVYIDNKKLFDNLGYTLIEENYTKYLGGYHV